MFRRNPTLAKNDSEIVEPLDISEQEKITDDLLNEAVESGVRTRWAYTWLFAAIALVYLAKTFYSLRYPWRISHQMVFYDLVSRTTFHCSYLGSSLFFLLLAYCIKVLIPLLIILLLR